MLYCAEHGPHLGLPGRECPTCRSHRIHAECEAEMENEVEHGADLGEDTDLEPPGLPFDEQGSEYRLQAILDAAGQIAYAEGYSGSPETQLLRRVLQYRQLIALDAPDVLLAEQRRMIDKSINTIAGLGRASRRPS